MEQKMDLNQAKEVVKKEIAKLIKFEGLVEDQQKLLGDASLLDSMSLVELCIQLEDYASNEGFEFDWTSDSTLSQSKSMFKTVESLSQEFYKQSSKTA